MERVELQRECEAVQIPAGNPFVLEKGTEAYLLQALGGSFTLRVPEYGGGLYRIAGKDADAIGKEPISAVPDGLQDAPLEAQVWAILKTCFDPEIPVNIVDLGLVYDMQIAKADDGGQRVDVKMTLTAQGCGMGASIAGDARLKLLDLPGVSNAEVEIVWDPPWTAQMISPEGRERLGMA